MIEWLETIRGLDFMQEHEELPIRIIDSTLDYLDSLH